MQALEGLRVIDMATVLAGPGRGPLPRRLRRRRDQGRDARPATAPAAWAGATRATARPYMWKLRRPEQARRRARPQDRRRPRRDAPARRHRRRARSRTSGPGTLERLGLDPTTCSRGNPRLVVLRVTGFGQDGPYAGRPGFATMAEAMSGFAAINGEPDGPPLLPPIALTDEITALVGAFAVMVALRAPRPHRRGSGRST